MKSSTLEMLRKHGWRRDRFIHNYIYFVFYYPYVKVITLALPLVPYLKWCRPLHTILDMAVNRYHAKILSSGDVKKILSLNHDISHIADENKQIIPFRYATKIIFQEPEHIAVMDCPCKKSYNTCEPVKCCIAVGKAISSFWLDHCQKYHAEKITQARALEIIHQYRERGHVTQAFFKVATGGCTGVICSCCPDCCAALRANIYLRQMESGLSMTAQSGYAIEHDAEKCTVCGKCAEVCHFNVVQVTDNQWRYARYNCMGCEMCVEQCPQGALSLYIDPEKPLPLDLDRIDRAKRGRAKRLISQQ